MPSCQVEINRLTACGVSVTYATPVDGAADHHATWLFSYHAELGGASEVLHLHMDSASGATGGVSVRVRGLPRGSAAIDPANFLFLQVRRQPSLSFGSFRQLALNFSRQHSFSLSLSPPLSLSLRLFPPHALSHV